MRLAAKIGFTDANGGRMRTTTHADSVEELKEKVEEVFSQRQKPFSNLSVTLVPPLSISLFQLISFVLVLGAITFLAAELGAVLFPLVTGVGKSAAAPSSLIVPTVAFFCTIVLCIIAHINFYSWQSQTKANDVENELAVVGRK